MPPEVARPEGGMSVERLSDGAIEIIDDLHTERLDYTSEYLPLIDAANKLDAYEDTGLEPEEIEQLKGEVFGLKVDKQELEKYRAIGPIDRLRELVEADRDGRCVVLPCKTGDAVWIIPERGARRAERWIVHRVYKRDAGRWCFDLKNMMLSQKRPNEFEMCRRSISSFGKTVFLTREAAEAALKGE